MHKSNLKTIRTGIAKAYHVLATASVRRTITIEYTVMKEETKRGYSQLPRHYQGWLVGID
jgi:hypothetical protein